MRSNPDLSAKEEVPEEELFPELWYDIVSKDHFWFYWRFKTLLNICQFLNIDLYKPYCALDIGSGNALLIKQLEPVSDWTIDGCDINPKFAGSLDIKGRYFQYDIYARSESLREQYDCIFLFDILEHLRDPAAFLDCAAFYLKKDGMIFINVPALQSLYGKYDKAVGHLARYNQNSMMDIINPSLFVVRDMRYWGMSITPLVAIRKVLNLGNNDNTKIITQGMKTPGRLINSSLKAVADIEASILGRPPFGCSLMLALQKK